MGPTGQTRRGTRRSAPWPWPSLRPAERRRTARRSCAPESHPAGSRSAVGCETPEDQPPRPHAPGQSKPAPRPRSTRPRVRPHAGRETRSPRESCVPCRHASPGTESAPARTPSRPAAASRSSPCRPKTAGRDAPTRRDLADDVNPLRLKPRQRVQGCRASRRGRHRFLARSLVQS